MTAVAALALLFLFGGALDAQTITSLSVDEGTLGSEFVVEGTGFGTKAPKVELLGERAGKKAKGTSLKVTVNSDTSLTVLVKKAPAGTFGLQVRPKGKGLAPIVSPTDFSVRGPDITTTETVAGSPGEDVDLDVDFLGLKAPKVSVGGLKAKAALIDADTVRITLPKKLADGTWAVVLDNKVGIDVAPGLVSVTGSDASLGKASVDVLIDGEPFKVSKKQLATSASAFGITLQLTRDSKGVQQQLVVQLPFDMDTELPSAVTALPDGLGVVRYEVTVDGELTRFVASTLDATLGAFDDGKLAGSLSATLSADSEEDMTLLASFLVDETFPITTPSSALNAGVSGLVLDTDLLPVAGVTLTSSAVGEPETTSAADGSFLFASHPATGDRVLIEGVDGKRVGLVVLDGTPGGATTAAGVLVLDIDSEGDGLSDWYELNVSDTSTSVADTDEDDFDDHLEAALGTDGAVADAPTTLMGMVGLPDRDPADGAALRVRGSPGQLATATTDSGGAFTFEQAWPATLTPVVLDASLSLDGVGSFEGASASTATVSDGVTAFATITLDAAASPAPFLFPGPKFDTGNSPHAVAVADFDNDGNPDLAVANRTAFDGNLAVLYGRGDGSFRVLEGYSAEGLLTGVAAGTLDANIRPDMVVCSWSNDEITVFFDTGPSAFIDDLPYTVGTEPEDVVLADFDGDGNLDVAVVNTISETVTVLLGAVGGNLDLGTNFDVGAAPRALAVGDLNADGDPDIVTANEDSADCSVLFGNGDGTFADSVDLDAGDDPSDVALGDLDGDDDLDIAVINRVSQDVSVLLNDGTGAFADAVSVLYGGLPSLHEPALVLADLDGDDALDIVIVLLLENDVVVLPGLGDGTFGELVTYQCGSNPQELAVADVDMDGNPDVLTVNGSSNDISVLFGQPDGILLAPGEIEVSFFGESLVAGDLTGNGKPDLVAAKSFTDEVTVFLGDGAGGFTEGNSFSAGSEVVDVALGDLDGDDRLDMAVASLNSDELSVRLGDGNGSFGNEQTLDVGNGPQAVLAVDVNGDDDLDLISANRNDDAVSVLLGNGNGGFSAAAPFDAGDGARAVAAGSFDAGGTVDLVVANELDDTISVLLGAGDGTFATPVDLEVGEDPWAVAVADLDDDEHDDIVCANAISGTLTIYLGKGDGSFENARTVVSGEGLTSFQIPDRPYEVLIADLDEDGVLDLAVAHYSGAEVSVLRGLGGGHFEPGQAFAVGPGTKSVTAADFDDDGHLDLAAIDESTSAWILLNQL